MGGPWGYRDSGFMVLTVGYCSDNTVLGRTLRSRRMTVFALSVETGINNRTLSSYVSGRLSPAAAHLQTIAEVLGLDPEELMDGPHWRLADAVGA